MVARVTLANVMWCLIEDFMYIMKKHITLHTDTIIWSTWWTRKGDGIWKK